MKLFVAGKITGFFGLKGYVKVQPASEKSERMASLTDVFVGASEQGATEHIVEDVILRQNAVLVKFAGIDDRTGAEKLRNCFLFVEESKAQSPPKGSFFIHDIVGCEVRDTEGALVGTVDDVQKFPAQDCWNIRTANGTFLIPAVKEFIRSVDLKKRTVVIRIIEGLDQVQSGGTSA